MSDYGTAPTGGSARDPGEGPSRGGIGVMAPEAEANFVWTDDGRYVVNLRLWREALVKRLDADRRQEGVWALGGVLHDAQRVERIAAKQDWPYLCVRATALERDVYERILGRLRPMSSIHGWTGDGPFHVSQDTLMALWRADSQKVACR